MYWQNFFCSILDQLFPRRCIGCQQEGIDACAACLSTLPQASKWMDIDGLHVWSAYDYNASGIDRYIQAWKYRGVTTFIGDWLALVVWPAIDADLIIPVPLHRRRLLERGFNQAETIAKHLGRVSGAPLSQAKRKRFTKAQAQCDGEERRRNVKGAFAIEEQAVRGKCVLLVDDVVTTGSTLNELAQALQAAGAKEVSAICLARGG